MKLKEILQDIKTSIDEPNLHIPYKILYRCILPDNIQKEYEIRDALAGACIWNGRDLIPCDNDNYDLNDEVTCEVDIDVDNNCLTVYYQGEFE